MCRVRMLTADGFCYFVRMLCMPYGAALRMLEDGIFRKVPDRRYVGPGTWEDEEGHLLELVEL